MRHEVRVEQVPHAELQKQLLGRWRARFAERHPDGVLEGDEYRLPTEAEEQAGVDELLALLRAEGGATEGAFAAYCSCGWTANNPVPTEAQAQQAVDDHETAVYGG